MPIDHLSKCCHHVLNSQNTRKLVGKLLLTHPLSSLQMRWKETRDPICSLSCANGTKPCYDGPKMDHTCQIEGQLEQEIGLWQVCYVCNDKRYYCLMLTLQSLQIHDNALI